MYIKDGHEILENKKKKEKKRLFSLAQRAHPPPFTPVHYHTRHTRKGERRKNSSRKSHIDMCYLVAFIYPGCGHLVGLPGNWIVERCGRADRLGKDCWMPEVYPPSYIQERVWNGKPDVHPCKTCASGGKNTTKTSASGGKNTTKK